MSSREVTVDPALPKPQENTIYKSSLVPADIFHVPPRDFPNQSPNSKETYKTEHGIPSFG